MVFALARYSYIMEAPYSSFFQCGGEFPRVIRPAGRMHNADFCGVIRISSSALGKKAYHLESRVSVYLRGSFGIKPGIDILKTRKMGIKVQHAPCVFEPGGRPFDICGGG